MDYLGLLIGILQSVIAVESAGWITRPKDLHLCSGQTATFRWEYDNFRRNATRITLSRVTRARPIVLLSREGQGQPKPTSARVTYRSNAGMVLKEVTSQDQGAYSSTVYFASENNSKNVTIIDEATLNVYTRCPTKHKYFRPRVYSKDHAGKFKKLTRELNISSLMPTRVLLLITLPAAVPPVYLKVYKEEGGFVEYACRGMKSRDYNCTAGLFFSRQGRYPVYVSVDYPAYLESGVTLDINITLKGGFQTSMVGAIVIPIIVLIVLVTIIFCQRKYGTEGFWQRCCDFCVGPEPDDTPAYRPRG